MESHGVCASKRQEVFSTVCSYILCKNKRTLKHLKAAVALLRFQQPILNKQIEHLCYFQSDVTLLHSIPLPPWRAAGTVSRSSLAPKGHASPWNDVCHWSRRNLSNLGLAGFQVESDQVLESLYLTHVGVKMIRQLQEGSLPKSRCGCDMSKCARTCCLVIVFVMFPGTMFPWISTNESINAEADAQGSPEEKAESQRSKDTVTHLYADKLGYPR